MKIIIIEDEALIAEELEFYISQISSKFEILTVLPSVKEALDYLNHCDYPDIFFSDIQLSDGLSFEIFEQLNIVKPVIFCTAFDQYAINAFKANGVDYILKPFNKNSIERALEKLNSLLLNKGENDVGSIKKIHDIIRHNTTKEKAILIRKGEQIFPVKISEIALISRENSITYVITHDEKKYVFSDSLDKIELEFGQNFFRINRQMIIQRSAISHASVYFARKLLVHPRFKYPGNIIVSKLKANDFLKWLEG